MLLDEEATDFVRLCEKRDDSGTIKSVAALEFSCLR